MTTDVTYTRCNPNAVRGKDNGRRDYQIDAVPERWIDALGMPSHGLLELAEFVRATMESGEGLYVHVHFCYLSHGVPFAASASFDPVYGIRIAVATPTKLYNMTPIQLTIVDAAATSIGSNRFGFTRPTTEVWVRHSTHVDDPAHWERESVERTVKTYDAPPKALHNDAGDVVALHPYLRPATKLAMIRTLTRKLDQAITEPMAIDQTDWRKLAKLLALVRPDGVESLNRMAPITAKDAEIYDDICTRIDSIGSQALRFHNAVAAVIKLAITTLPRTYPAEQMMKAFAEHATAWAMLQSDPHH